MIWRDIHETGPRTRLREDERLVAVEMFGGGGWFLLTNPDPFSIGEVEGHFTTHAEAEEFADRMFPAGCFDTEGEPEGVEMSLDAAS